MTPLPSFTYQMYRDSIARVTLFAASLPDGRIQERREENGEATAILSWMCGVGAVRHNFAARGPDERMVAVYIDRRIDGFSSGLKCDPCVKAIRSALVVEAIRFIEWEAKESGALLRRSTLPGGGLTPPRHVATMTWTCKNGHGHVVRGDGATADDASVTLARNLRAEDRHL